MQYLLPNVPKFFKTALHCHTTISDGAPTPEETKEGYKSKGYSALCITDHNIIADHSAMNDEDFLLLTGAEYNINEPGVWKERLQWMKTYHLNFIAKRPDNLWQPFGPAAPKDTALPHWEKADIQNMPRQYCLEDVNNMIAEANRRGFLVMYNHPCWSLQSYPDYAGLKGLWGMEICNYSAAHGGYADNDNGRVYDDLVSLGNDLVPLGTDDAHSMKEFGGAWTMVGARELSYAAMIEAMEKGDVYASTGPQIHSLTLEDGMLHITCSDAQSITLHSGDRIAKSAYPTAPDKLVREATFKLSGWLEKVDGSQPTDWIRVVVRDAYGSYAATRAYRRSELKG